jgi:predicted transcriptional regulator
MLTDFSCENIIRCCFLESGLDIRIYIKVIEVSSEDVDFAED